VSTKVVKPRPSRIPYRPAATGIGISRRQCSGSWRRTCGTIAVPRISAIAAANAITAATPRASRPPAPWTSSPARASVPNVTAPPASAPKVNVTQAKSVVARPPV
jgi:hypothetical protein